MHPPANASTNPDPRRSSEYISNMKLSAATPNAVNIASKSDLAVRRSENGHSRSLRRLRPSASAALHPPLALEEEHERDAGNEHAPEAEHEEGPGRRDRFRHKPREVHAEEAGDEGQRQEDRADDRELLHHFVLAVADRREVEVRGV